MTEPCSFRAGKKPQESSYPNAHYHLTMSVVAGEGERKVTPPKGHSHSAGRQD